MSQKIAKRKRYHYYLIGSFVLILLVALGVFEIFSQFSVVNRYLNNRFSYLYSDAEQYFYDRYSLFTEELKLLQLENPNNEAMRLMIIESQQNCSLSEYDFLDYSFSFLSPQIQVKVVANYYENLTDLHYSRTYTLNFILQKKSLFTYQIADIINTEAHSH